MSKNNHYSISHCEDLCDKLLNYKELHLTSGNLSLLNEFKNFGFIDENGKIDQTKVWSFQQFLKSISKIASPYEIFPIYLYDDEIVYESRLTNYGKLRYSFNK